MENDTEVCSSLINKDVFKFLIKEMPDDIKDDFKNELMNCEDTDKVVGGRRKKSRRKMRGGDEAFKKKIMVCLYLFLGIVISYLIATTETVTLQEGFMMLWTGRCTTLSEMSLNLIGFGNPVCSKYQKMIAVVGYAVKYDSTAITQIIGALTIALGTTIATPYLLHRTIMGIAGQVEMQVARLTGETQLAIENGEELPSDRQILNGATDSAEDLINQIKAQPGLLEKLKDLLNSGENQELNLDEDAIEDIDASSRDESKESSHQEEYGGSKRSKTKRRRNSKKNKKNKKHTRKHHKRSKKNRRH
jgi:hypothetical protein